MSRRNRQRNSGAPDTPEATGQASPSGEDEAAEAPAARGPYHAAEVHFGPTYGGAVNVQAFNAYLYAFAREQGAKLLQVHPTTLGSYLFIWEMP